MKNAFDFDCIWLIHTIIIIKSMWNCISMPSSFSLYLAIAKNMEGEKTDCLRHFNMAVLWFVVCHHWMITIIVCCCLESNLPGGFQTTLIVHYLDSVILKSVFKRGNLNDNYLVNLLDNVMSYWLEDFISFHIFFVSLNRKCKNDHLQYIHHHHWRIGDARVTVITDHTRTNNRKLLSLFASADPFITFTRFFCWFEGPKTHPKNGHPKMSVQSIIEIVVDRFNAIRRISFNISLHCWNCCCP